jgi:hypothetical protein
MNITTELIFVSLRGEDGRQCSPYNEDHHST